MENKNADCSIMAGMDNILKQIAEMRNESKQGFIEVTQNQIKVQETLEQHQNRITLLETQSMAKDNKVDKLTEELLSTQKNLQSLEKLIKSTAILTNNPPQIQKTTQGSKMMIFNLPGNEQGSDLLEIVTEFIENTLDVRGIKPLNVRRFRPRAAGEIGPIIVALEDREALITLLSYGKNLQGSKISICEDLPPAAREIKKHILAERKTFLSEKQEVKMRGNGKIIGGGVTYVSDGKKLSRLNKSIPENHDPFETDEEQDEMTS